MLCGCCRMTGFLDSISHRKCPKHLQSDSAGLLEITTVPVPTRSVDVMCAQHHTSTHADNTHSFVVFMGYLLEHLWLLTEDPAL